MLNRPSPRVVAVIAVPAFTVAFAGLTSPAAAGPGTFGCTVTALRIGTTDLAVANPAYNPCEDDRIRQEISTPILVEGYAVTAEALLASTDVQDRSASATGSALNLTIAAGSFTLDAEQTMFGTSTTCVENSQGKPTAQHPVQTAELSEITITPVGGEPITILSADPQQIAVPGVGTAYVMQSSTKDTRPGHKTEEVTASLLFLDVTSGPDVTLLETRTDFSGQSCAPGTTK